ncbi:MAG TPA: SxtJ family membrane protein [Candidatus Baltobacteraceae bacterium]|jgi:ABC-type phosphate transport system permease subunit|nr:SxtJ family membrane protein [Candidatus Baltobacteraceae bacterium]
MKLKLKEEPKEWRKAVWMSALGLALLSSLLRWRRVLPVAAWGLILCALAALAVAAARRPRWFRGYYRFSAKVGFVLSQIAGHIVLVLLFFIVVTPLGLALRMMGKDPLRLRHPVGAAESYWSEVRGNSSLDRLF